MILCPSHPRTYRIPAFLCVSVISLLQSPQLDQSLNPTGQGTVSDLSVGSQGTSFVSTVSSLWSPGLVLCNTSQGHSGHSEFKIALLFLTLWSGIRKELDSVGFIGLLLIRNAEAGEDKEAQPVKAPA